MCHEEVCLLLLLQTLHTEGNPACITQKDVLYIAVDPWAVCMASKQCTESEVGAMHMCGDKFTGGIEVELNDILPETKYHCSVSVSSPESWRLTDLQILR